MALEDLLQYTTELRGAVGQLTKPRLVITAPHAACRSAVDVAQHTCDVVCARVAEEINKSLSVSEVMPKLFKADINRMDMDMNRPEARGSDFRNAVDQELAGAVFLLDVHSFPELDIPWDVDLFLLKLSYGGNNSEIVYDLSKYLIAEGLNVAVVKAEKPNDVVLSAIERKVPAVLVEFSEPQVEKNGELVKKFVTGFQKFLKEKLRGEK